MLRRSGGGPKAAPSHTTVGFRRSHVKRRIGPETQGLHCASWDGSYLGGIVGPGPRPGGSAPRLTSGEVSTYPTPNRKVSQVSHPGAPVASAAIQMSSVATPRPTPPYSADLGAR